MTKTRTKLCANCAFHNPDPTGQWKGECRKHPPTVAGMSDDLGAIWPGVYPHDWCGEHQPKRGRQLLGNA